MSVATAMIRDLLDSVDADLNAKDARIAELEAQLAPPASRMLAGASVQPMDGETWPLALYRFETSVGARLHVVRRFIGGAPTVTSSRVADVLAADPPYEALVISWTQGTHAEMVDFLTALPRNGTRYYVVLRHEPDKQLRVSGPAFREMCAALLRACRYVGRDDVHPTFVLMSWLERDGDATTSSADYFPDEPAEWVMALDPYFPKAEHTYASQMGPTVALWRAYGGSRIAIAEFGVKTTGQEAADQIAGIVRDAHADGCEFVCYFDSNVGDNAGAGWYLRLRGPEAERTFGALLNG